MVHCVSSINFCFQVKPGKIEEVDWEKVMGKLTYDEKVGPVEWAKPGTKSGLR
jgi:hypothetical protein